MKILSTSLLFLFILSACSNSADTKKVSMDSKFSIMIPEILEETKDLNEDASLQFQNLEEELYVLVIDENKKELFAILDQNEVFASYPRNLEGYTMLFTDGFEGDPSFAEKPKPIDQTINGLPAKVISLQSNSEGMVINYKFALIEGKEDFYQIMTWTIAEKLQKHEAAMNEIVHSFVEN